MPDKLFYGESSPNIKVHRSDDKVTLTTLLSQTELDQSEAMDVAAAISAAAAYDPRPLWKIAECTIKKGVLYWMGEMHSKDVDDVRLEAARSVMRLCAENNINAQSAITLAKAALEMPLGNDEHLIKINKDLVVRIRREDASNRE